MPGAVAARQPLRWFALWRGAGWLWLVWVIYESLTPTPMQTPGIEFGDKIGHFCAYFIMMGWFAQLYHRSRHGLFLLAFIALGVALEFLQGQSGYRAFEYADMAANSLGALSGWLLAAGSFSFLLLRLEQRLAARPR
jgi:VanZ family protein